MKMHQIIATAAITLFAFAGVSANAASLSDNFDTENGGSAQLNYTGFQNFTVSSGSVDLIGNGAWDFHSGNGLYVDLCGTTNQCGALTTKTSFGPGTYTITLGLGGIGYDPANNGVGVNQSTGIQVSFGNSSTTYNAPAWNATGSVTEVVTLTGASQLTIADLGLSGNKDVGANLLSVSVSPVPVPGALLMFGTALVGLGGYARRQARRKTA